MSITSDRASRDSRERLTRALFAVMEQYLYTDITVTQIAQEARLSRKTFYRFYRTKDEVLNEYIQSVMLDFSVQLRELDIHHYWEVVQLYFDFWEQRADIILLFNRHGLLPVLMEAARGYADRVFAAVRSDEVARRFSPLLPYMLAYAVGGMHNMLVAWITGGKTIPSSALIQSLKQGLQSPDI